MTATLKTATPKLQLVFAVYTDMTGSCGFWASYQDHLEARSMAANFRRHYTNQVTGEACKSVVQAEYHEVDMMVWMGEPMLNQD